MSGVFIAGPDGEFTNDGRAMMVVIDQTAAEVRGAHESLSVTERLFYGEGWRP